MIVLIMYDMGVVVGFVDDVMVMYVGCIVEYVLVDLIFVVLLYLYMIGLFNVLLWLIDVDDVLFVVIFGNLLMFGIVLVGCVFVKCCMYVEECCGVVCLVFEIYGVVGVVCVCYCLVVDLMGGL